MSEIKKIAVLFSTIPNRYGESASVETAQNLADTLKELGYDASIYKFSGFTNSTISHLKTFDLVFNICYGYCIPKRVDISQEQVVEWLDSAEILHTTTKYKEHLLAMDKAAYPKAIEGVKGLNSPQCLPLGAIVGEVIKKPRFGSCHHDITIYKNAVDISQPLDPKFLYQEYIKGREFTLTVIPELGKKGFIVLPPTEVICQNEVYIFGNGTIVNYAPTLELKTLTLLTEAVRKLHTKFNFVGLTRTDFKLTADGKLYLLDINVMPNLDYIKPILASVGIDYKEALQRIVESVI